MRITIPGNPIPKHRVRSATRHGKVFTYSDQAAQTNDVKWQIKAQYKGKPLTGAVGVTAIYYMPIPKSWSKKKKREHIGKWHIAKPDKDNLEKFIKDCGNGILWNDDSQCALDFSVKVYDDNPRLELYIKQIDHITLTQILGAMESMYKGGDA
jgi:Holliday junction resolvase RusA-like endonuclease